MGKKRKGIKKYVWAILQVIRSKRVYPVEKEYYYEFVMTLECAIEELADAGTKKEKELWKDIALHTLACMKGCIDRTFE